VPPAGARHGLAVEEVDGRLQAAVASQLVAWREALASGAARVGWKLGVGDAERIGREIAVGHLTSASLVAPGSSFAADPVDVLHADAEIAVRLGRDLAPDGDGSTVRAAIAGYGVALEIVDLSDAERGAETVVAGNIFHRAVSFGRFRTEPPAHEAEGRLLVNGTTRITGPLPVDVIERVRAAARVLSAVGEQLRAGDLVITGSVVQVAVDRGDEVVAEIGSLGSVGLVISR